MNGTTIASHGSAATLADPNWKIVGSGDYDGDGKSDVLWRNAVTGDDYLWFMNGTSLASAAAVASVADLNWKIAGSGDYNGDGKADILWRNSTTRRGLRVVDERGGDRLLRLDGHRGRLQLATDRARRPALRRAGGPGRRAPAHRHDRQHLER